VTPAQVNALTIVDFAHLVSGIRQHKAARPAAAPGEM
jgi:hypothetical protein